MAPTSHNMYCPEVIRKEYMLMDINKDGYLSLMDEEDGSLNEGLKCEDLTVKIFIIVIC